MYNIRIKRFAGSGVQVSLYSILVEEKEKGKKRKKREQEHDYLVDPFTGEVWDSLEDKHKSESLRVSYIRTINSIYDIALIEFQIHSLRKSVGIIFDIFFYTITF